MNENHFSPFFGTDNNSNSQDSLHLEETPIIAEIVETDEQSKSNAGRQFRSTDTTIAQQALQERVNHLLGELDASQQTVQQQQLQVESLSGQLETTQGQMAQLERQCALLQEDYHEKRQQSIAADKQIRELRSRLHRQQRYTLQYKAALDRCSNIATGKPDIVPQITPIQPWSSVGIETPMLKDDNPMSSLNPPELEQDPIDDFLENLEQAEVVPDIKAATYRPADWPSPVISPVVSIKKYSLKSVDLPTFVRERSNPT